MKNKNKDKDYVFYICWENSKNKDYKIGLLAKIDDYYYLKINTKEHSSAAYEKGCIGLPGFRDDMVYRSENLFDFFQNRIFDKGNEDVCKELVKTQGRSFIDSFFVKEVPHRIKEKSKHILLNMYKNQEELRKINSQIIIEHKENDHSLRAN